MTYVPNSTFLVRSQAREEARKLSYSTFRTVLTKEGVWKLTYEPGDCPVRDWAIGKEWVAWVETAWDNGTKHGVAVVTITKAELDVELTTEPAPDGTTFEPVTPSLWGDDKPPTTGKAERAPRTPRETSAGIAPPRAKSDIESPVKVVWRICDEAQARVGAGERPNRKEVIAACIAAGVNPATASTQFSKWTRRS